MSLATPDTRARYCVMYPGFYGPDPSFWGKQQTVLKLLASHCNHNCGHGVTVWHRRTAASKWKLITDTKP